jgi:phytoene synthase
LVDALDAALKLGDTERWLATRFVGDPKARADLVALYALDFELAAISRRAGEPLAAEIRLTWWRERIEAAASGHLVREAPALDALQPALAGGGLCASLVLSALDARFAELHRPWFEDEADLDAYLDAVGADLGEAAVRRLDPSADVTKARPGFRAFALDRLMRSVDPALWTPNSWSNAHPNERAAHLRHKLTRELAAARRSPGLSDLAFPALAHVTLVRRSRPDALADRIRVLIAVARGRI